MADERPVGLTYVRGVVAGPLGSEAEADFLVDSGATYTLLPESLWRGLGLTPHRTMAFRLADGTEMQRQISECRVRLPQGIATTTVILGEPEDVALLGVLTLEELGLVLNPFDRTLHPMKGWLLTFA